MKTLVFDGNDFACKKVALVKKIIKNNPQISKHILRVYLVGNNPASRMYLSLKKKLFLSLEIGFEDIYLSESIMPDKLIKLIGKSNVEEGVGGIVVQLPLPNHWTELEVRNVLDAINPDKDIDCLTSTNQKLLTLNRPKYIPATVKAVLLILKSIKIDKNNIGKYITCILGKSDLVGKPLSDLLRSLGGEVISCDEYTSNICEKTRKSDIVISATGVPGLLKKHMVKPGAVIIDVGEPKGDVDFENVKKDAFFITPVPGGVGPVTVVCLLDNFVSSIV